LQAKTALPSPLLMLIADAVIQIAEDEIFTSKFAYYDFILNLT